jgi:hypothetical protein
MGPVGVFCGNSGYIFVKKRTPPPGSGRRRRSHIRTSVKGKTIVAHWYREAQNRAPTFMI